MVKNCPCFVTCCVHGNFFWNTSLGHITNHATAKVIEQFARNPRLGTRFSPHLIKSSHWPVFSPAKTVEYRVLPISLRHTRNLVSDKSFMSNTKPASLANAEFCRFRGYRVSSANNTFASFKSAVPKPSVNHPYTGASRS